MKVVALLIGVALLALGVAGFVPALNHDGMLFGRKLDRTGSSSQPSCSATRTAVLRRTSA